MPDTDWNIKRERYKKFCDTPLGKAFLKFENAHASAWQYDSVDHPLEAKLDNLWIAEKEARKELMNLLAVAAGVEKF